MRPRISDTQKCCCLFLSYSYRFPTSRHRITFPNSDVITLFFALAKGTSQSPVSSHCHVHRISKVGLLLLPVFWYTCRSLSLSPFVFSLKEVFQANVWRFSTGISVGLSSIPPKHRKKINPERIIWSIDSFATRPHLSFSFFLFSVDKRLFNKTPSETKLVEVLSSLFASRSVRRQTPAIDTERPNRGDLKGTTSRICLSLNSTEKNEGEKHQMCQYFYGWCERDWSVQINAT